MNTRIDPRLFVVVLALLVIGAGMLSFSTTASGFQEGGGPDPGLTPALPSPTPIPNSPLTEIALQYISAKEGIPVDQLIVTSQEPLNFVYLDQSFWRVVMIPAAGLGEYEVLVDVQDKTITEDRQAVEQADRAAKEARYGKLEPALYERLESIQSADVVEVVIWLAGAPPRSQQERFAVLAEKYPQAREAMEKTGNPYAVGDYKLIMELKQEYLRLMEEDYRAQVQPFTAELQALGYQTTALKGLPAVFLKLPKQAILQLAARSDVGAIYLGDERVAPKMDAAGPSDRAPVVWNRGITGSGVDIAILEIGEVDFTRLRDAVITTFTRARPTSGVMARA